MTKLFSNQTKGYLFALIATISFSNVYIFSKAALNEISLGQFWLYWFAFALIYNVLFALKSKAFRPLKQISLKELAPFFYLWILEILTTATFFIGINTIPDPAVTSFLGNMYMVFLILLGVIMLKERFSKIETLGVIITVIGVFAVGYEGGSSFKDFFIPGTGIIIINCFLAAYTSIIAKKTVEKYSPSLVNVNRTFALFIAAIIYFTATKQSLHIPVSAFKNIAIGSILGPFMGILAIYYSYKYIEASKSSVVQGLKGIFVLIGSFIYFGLFPETIQWIGGTLTVIGVLVMTTAKAKNKA